MIHAVIKNIWTENQRYIFIPHILLLCLNLVPTLPVMHQGLWQQSSSCVMTKSVHCGSASVFSVFFFFSHPTNCKDMIPHQLPTAGHLRRIVFVGMRDQSEGLNPSLCGDEWVLCFCTICVSLHWVNEIRSLTPTKLLNIFGRATFTLEKSELGCGLGYPNDIFHTIITNQCVLSTVDVC